jgi:nucleosome binding factor SPN SPT16 subunit
VKQDFTVLLVNTRLKLKELVMLLMKRDLLSKSLVHLDTFVMEPLEMLPFWLTQTNMVMV